jgi:hypothetical protein
MVLKLIWAAAWRLGLLAIAVGVVLYVGVTRHGWIPGGPDKPVERAPLVIEQTGVKPTPDAADQLADQLTVQAKEITEQGKKISDAVGQTIEQAIGEASVTTTTVPTTTKTTTTTKPPKNKAAKGKPKVKATPDPIGSLITDTLGSKKKH